MISANRTARFDHQRSSDPADPHNHCGISFRGARIHTRATHHAGVLGSCRIIATVSTCSLCTSCGACSLQYQCVHSAQYACACVRHPVAAQLCATGAE